MINRITLLLFIGLAWGQDEYPYFSDMQKQLSFEQKKIVIKSTSSNKTPNYILFNIEKGIESLETILKKHVSM
mgnify:CR=1 FL=1